MRFVYFVWGQNEFDIVVVIEISSNELLVFGPRAAGNKYLFPCAKASTRGNSLAVRRMSPTRSKRVSPTIDTLSMPILASSCRERSSCI